MNNRTVDILPYILEELEAERMKASVATHKDSNNAIFALTVIEPLSFLSPHNKSLQEVKPGDIIALNPEEVDQVIGMSGRDYTIQYDELTKQKVA